MNAVFKEPSEKDFTEEFEEDVLSDLETDESLFPFIESFTNRKIDSC